MSSASAIKPVQAPREVWEKLRQILGDQYDGWVDSLPAAMRSDDAHFAYVRKRRDQVFYLQVAESGWDVIVTVNLPEFGPQVIVVEDVMPQKMNRFRTLTPGELALLEFISPYMSG